MHDNPEHISRPLNMVARLQQVISFTVLALILFLCGLWWTRSFAQAWVGIALLLLVYPALLACEFGLLCRAQRQASAPRPSLRSLCRAWAGEVRHGTAVFFWRQPFRAHAVSDDLSPRSGDRRGVVFVHGLFGNRGFWTPWLLDACRRGVPYLAIDLEPISGDIDHYVARVDDAVQRMHDSTGHAPLLVCHSMGGLAARAWLQASPDALHRITRVVTIGSPHAGTWMARFGHGINARQMHIGSHWLQQLSRSETTAHRERFVCWWSDCDNIVFPTIHATLPDADNRKMAGIAHVALAFEPRVMQETWALVQHGR